MRKRICSLIVVVALFFAMVQVAPVSAEETASSSSSAVEETEEAKEDLTQRYDPNDYGVKKSTKNGVTTIKFDGGKEKLTIKKNGEIYWDYVPLSTLYGGVLGKENIKFLGIDSSQTLYILNTGGGAGVIFFNKKNIFSAKRISTWNIEDTTCETDKNGYLVNLVIRNNKISIYDDVSSYYGIKIKEEYPGSDLAMKKGSHKYVVYFKKYKMVGTVTWKKKNKRLYFNGKLIAKNITKKITKERFGLYVDRSIILFSKGKKLYYINPKTKKKSIYMRRYKSVGFYDKVNIIWVYKK